MKTIKAIMVKPKETPKTTELKVSIDSFNKAVSVDTDYDCLACCKRLERGVYILYADEGGVLFFPPNRRIGDDIISGVFYVIGAKDGKPVSLTKKQIEKYTEMFANPEEYSENDALLLHLDNLTREIDEMKFQEL